jgi:hypothetical protein
VPVNVAYSTPGKPLLINFECDSPGICCEFIIATTSDSGSAQSSGIQTRWTTQSRQQSVQSRQPSVQNEERMMMDEEDTGLGWGVERAMSPARTSRTREEEEEDLYGDPMRVEDEEEEVPPTQQERYQGIFEI